MKIRNLVLPLASMCTVMMPALALADYPDKPITMVVPFAVGGNSDITARIIAPALGKALNTTIVVVNKPGAGGIIGTAQVAKAEADGYTLLMTTPNAIAVAPFMAPTGYKTADFSSVGMIAETPLLIDANPNGKYQTIQELLKSACDKPGTVTVGHSGIGTTNYVALINLEEATGCTFNAIPYKGAGPAIVDLAGGQLDFVIDQLSSSTSLIAGGKIKVLAVMTAERVPALKDIPTLRESGMASIDASTVIGVVAPKSTPETIVKKLNAALRQVAEDDIVKRAFDGVGSTAKWSSPDDFDTLLGKEEEQARRLSDAGKLTVK
ncbi:ABC transporter substrate-binding protein [Bordetella tumbae]|uniref:Bug family tripartite tricarboxylate transporter substrate binding protein n=1 Tax=Bordetella tumbae TaxID=1649139 RepID=UPI0039EE6EC2